MIIEINPRSLLNLEHICEVLYKLHPLVLNHLVEMERNLGPILGLIDLDNLSLEEREFLSNNYQEEDYSSEPMEEDDEEVKITTKTFDNKEDLNKYLKECQSKYPNVKILGGNGNECLSNNPNVKILGGTEDEEDEEYKKMVNIIKYKYLDVVDENSKRFHNLRKYIQLDTDEYIPMKIYVEVEDPVIGKKVCELVRALEKTRAPEQFYLNKKEMDEDAYFAEGYGLTANEEQKKKFDDFFWVQDSKGLEELLRKEKLYP